jgi:hypothetical protein
MSKRLFKNPRDWEILRAVGILKRSLAGLRLKTCGRLRRSALQLS